MVDTAESVVILADHSKWGRREMVRSFVWDEVDTLVTDKLPANMRAIRKKVIIAE
jgi:DeoR/GlpR family transcriptional regulator of sugar metabolism